jgi:hypothetical protein
MVEFDIPVTGGHIEIEVIKPESEYNISYKFGEKGNYQYNIWSHNLNMATFMKENGNITIGSKERNEILTERLKEALPKIPQNIAKDIKQILGIK